MWTTALVIAVLTAAAVVVALWWPATAGLTGADLVKARLDALKIGLSVGVGSGGVVALYLAWRRQHSTEADLDNRERALAQQGRAADDVRADATERRITELYTKAVEQLGSDKAPVRLGGLYALERLAQDNESQRQTIVNVLCAYLRMPYDITGPPPDDADTEQLEQHRALVQEREVRLTAQRVLTDHLKPDRGTAYWGELDLDLTGAQLINLNLDNVLIGTSTFARATFIGHAGFTGATFAGDTDFLIARFTSNTVFAGTTFAKGAWFSLAVFENPVSFDKATFNDHADFHETTFTQQAYFKGTTFIHLAVFGKANFTGTAAFTSASFARKADFSSAEFTHPALFVEGAFSGQAIFSDTHFGSGAMFTRATFTRDAFFSETAFSDAVNFVKATFSGETSFASATFVEDAHFFGATFSKDPDFTKATLAGKPYKPGEVASNGSLQPGPPDPSPSVPVHDSSGG